LKPEYAAKATALQQSLLHENGVAVASSVIVKELSVWYGDKETDYNKPDPHVDEALKEECPDQAPLSLLNSGAMSLLKSPLSAELTRNAEVSFC